MSETRNRPAVEVLDVPASREEVLHEAHRILDTHPVDDASHLAALVVSLLEGDEAGG